MPEKRRLLYFSSQFPSTHYPSMGIFSLQRVRALRDSGCEVEVVSPVLLTPPPQLITKPLQAYRWIRRQEQQPIEMNLQGIPVHYQKWVCPPKKIFGWYMSYFLFLQMRNRIVKVAREFHPDIILSSWLPDGVAASKFGEMLNIPVLSIADGTDVNQWPQKYRAWGYARNILNGKVSVLIFVSDALQAAGRSKGLHGKKSIVLHNAVDINLFKPDLSSTKRGVYTILGVGRLVPSKGFQILLEAFSKFNQSIDQPARLILIGDGQTRTSLTEQAEKLGIQSQVDFVGSVKQEELVSYFQTADVFCLPSYMEGFPCVVVEAMACGKPVVATTVGGIAEVVDSQSGILIEPGNAQTLCEALIQARNRAWDGDSIRRKIVDGFEIGKWAADVIQLMDTVSK
jgi:teichuronic acid biosynthesis glycosyltransferase TuaC